MIRPIELQVAWKAIPVQASQVYYEQASSVYRSIQGMKDAYNRNKLQANTVQKLLSSTGNTMLSQSQNSDVNTSYQRRVNSKQLSKKQAKLNAIYYPRFDTARKGIAYADGELINQFS